jgi:hypothetical protein
MHLSHRTATCPGNFIRLPPAPAPADVVRCDTCGAEYPADVHTLLSVAREHLAGMYGHLASTRGRIALRRASRGPRAPPVPAPEAAG